MAINLTNYFDFESYDYEFEESKTYDFFMQ